MEDDVRKRFERIEENLERVGERMDRISAAHIELEAAQKNVTVALERFITESDKRGKKIDERIENLAILVDQLIKKDLGNSHEPS